MTKPQLLRMMRLLSALESLMLVNKERLPDCLHVELSELVELLEHEILKGD